MNNVNRSGRVISIAAFVAAEALMVAAMPAGAAAALLPVYGGPTYSSSAGGYLSRDDSTSPAAYVNDAGTAVATAAKRSSSGAALGSRAVRWSATSAASELGGSPNSLRAGGINAGGTVIGSAMSANQGRPTRWGPAGAAATILEHPHINSPASWPGVTFLTDINDAGTAVGNVYRSSFDEGGAVVNETTHPGRWNGAGTALTELGLLGANADGVQYGEVRAINAAGVAVGVSRKSGADGKEFGFRAVRWAAAGTVATELGTLGTAQDQGTNRIGWTRSTAVAVNRDGTALGISDVYDDAGQLQRRDVPVRWDPSGNPTRLGGLTPGDVATLVGSPASLNDAGTAIGFTYKQGADSGYRALRWDASSPAAVELGVLGRHATGIADSKPTAINAAGTVVGWVDDYDDASVARRAVYWGGDLAAVDLNTLIDPTSGWSLTQALGISDTGWIVGEGAFDPDGAGGQSAYPRYFLMHVPATVPEPGALALLGLAIPSLLRRRRPHWG